MTDKVVLIPAVDCYNDRGGSIECREPPNCPGNQNARCISWGEEVPPQECIPCRPGIDFSISARSLSDGSGTICTCLPSLPFPSDLGLSSVSPDTKVWASILGVLLLIFALLRLSVCVISKFRVHKQKGKRR